MIEEIGRERKQDDSKDGDNRTIVAYDHIDRDNRMTADDRMTADNRMITQRTG